MVLLDKAFLADPAPKSSQLQMAPYMVFHIAELLWAVIALETEEPLVFAASLRIDDDALLVMEPQLCFHEFSCFFHAELLVNIV